MELFRETHFDFVRWMKLSVTISLIMLAAGMVSLVAKGGPRWSVDFRGGTVLQVRIKPAPPIAEVRRIIAGAGFTGAQVQDFGAADEFLLDIEQVAGIANAGQVAHQALVKGLPNATVELRREESVGPKVGGELRTAAANSVLASLILIILYVGVRFVFRYGVAGVLALFHDVLTTLGLFSILNKEISLSIIAAFLTIVGYSIMDSVVVFDRIRENMKMRRREGYAEVINMSINQTLSRTVLTSGLTLLTTISLLLFGGPAIHDFAFALTFGVAVGTYSSIFIAAPILVWRQQRAGADKRRQPAM